MKAKAALAAIVNEWMWPSLRLADIGGCWENWFRGFLGDEQLQLLPLTYLVLCLVHTVFTWVSLCLWHASYNWKWASLCLLRASYNWKRWRAVHKSGSMPSLSRISLWSHRLNTHMWRYHYVYAGQTRSYITQGNIAAFLRDYIVISSAVQCQVTRHQVKPRKATARAPLWHCCVLDDNVVFTITGL